MSVQKPLLLFPLPYEEESKMSKKPIKKKNFERPGGGLKLTLLIVLNIMFSYGNPH